MRASDVLSKVIGRCELPSEVWATVVDETWTLLCEPFIDEWLVTRPPRFPPPPLPASESLAKACQLATLSRRFYESHRQFMAELAAREVLVCRPEWQVSSEAERAELLTGAVEVAKQMARWSIALCFVEPQRAFNPEAWN